MASRSQGRTGGNRRTAGGKSSAVSGSWKPVFAGSNSSKATLNNDPEEDNDDLFNENKYCVVCAEKLVYAAKSPCNHTTCHLCSFRQRALYDKKACLVCRTENEDLIFTETLTSDYQELKKSIVSKDSKYTISFTSQSARDTILKLLDFNCALCSYVGSDYPSLSEHLKSRHEKFLCILCSSNKKAFPFELQVYSQKQLQTHLIRGDENDENFNGHPICKFCKGKRFYSTDELNMHYRKNHEECHVCKIIEPQNPQYFKNYDSLEEHFRTDHYICTVQSCLDRKFVVFADELDLRAHLISEHPTLYGSNFVYGSNQSSASSSRLHSHLSTFSAGAKKATTSNEESNDSIKIKKMRLEERARHYVNYDNTKFTLFRELNTTFNNGYVSAQQLKDAYIKLFSTNSTEEINLLLFDLCETLRKSSSKYSELSSIVSIQKQILDHQDDEKFPALSASSSSVDLGPSWVNSAIKTKKQQRKNLLDDFPPLQAPPKQKSKLVTPSLSSWSSVSRPVAKTTTIKSAKTMSKAPMPAVRIPNYLDTKPASPSLSSTSSSSSFKKPAVKLSDELFPALPTQTRKVIPRVNPIPTGNGSWDIGAPTARNSSTFDLSSVESALIESNNSSSGNFKKNKKKKQILFQTGGRI